MSNANHIRGQLTRGFGQNKNETVFEWRHNETYLSIKRVPPTVNEQGEVHATRGRVNTITNVLKRIYIYWIPCRLLFLELGGVHTNVRAFHVVYALTTDTCAVQRSQWFIVDGNGYVLSRSLRQSISA